MPRWSIHDLTLPQKLHGLALLTCSIALAVTCAAFVAYDHLEFHRNHRRHVAILADMVGENVRAALEFDDDHVARRVLSSLGNEPAIARAAIYKADHATFVTWEQNDAIVDDADIKVLRPIRLEQRTIGFIEVVSDTRELEKRTTTVLLIAAGILFVTMLIGFGIASQLQKLITRPIFELARASKNFAERNYHDRAKKLSNDELGSLVDTFNRMLDEIDVQRCELEQHRATLELEVDKRTSELSATNRRLEQSIEEARAANRIKSEFLATMSHEIRTPINGILGMSSLLADTTLVSEQRTFVERVQSCAEVLLTMINDILDVSKIEAGKLELERVDIRVRDLIASTLDVVAVKAEQKQLELAWFVDAGVPEVLRGDPGRLRQILTNLAGNAVKFTEAGQVVVRVGCAEKTGMFRFEVEDSGIGIEPDAVSKLFGAFVQADNSHSRKYGGTGLGLAISKSLVELMGGQIAVESEPSRGSKFWFTAELGRAEAELEPAVIAAHAPVLYASASELTRRMLAALTNAPIARNAQEIFAALDKERYVALVVDEKLEDADAADLFERLSEAKSPLALVGLTSLKPDVRLRRLEQRGRCALVTKPVAPWKLDRAITNLAAAKASAAAVSPVADTARLEGRVLLVEDNAVNEMVAARYLEKLGLHVEVARDGGSAIRMTADQTYDVILMDCQMPEVDGFEATRRIRERETPADRTPIIALTANAMRGDRERCLASGMDAYLSKPLRPAELKKVISHWLGQKKTPDFGKELAP